MSVALKEHLWVHELNANSKQIREGEQTYFLAPTQYPQDIQLEERVLGGIIARADVGDKALVQEILRGLDYTDFYLTRHALVFRSIQRIQLAQGMPTTESLIVDLRHHKPKGASALEHVGGEGFIYQLASMPDFGLEGHVKQLQRLSLNRQTVVAAEWLRQVGMDTTGDTHSIRIKVQKVLTQLNAKLSALEGHKQVRAVDVLRKVGSQAIHETQDTTYQPGIEIWLGDLNSKLLGWRNGLLYIVAAGTEMGKTAFLCQSAFEAYKRGAKVLYVATEQSEDEVMDRIIPLGARVDAYRYMKRGMYNDETERVRDFISNFDQIGGTNDFIIASLNNPTPDEVRAQIDIAQPDIVFVDYVGIEVMSAGTYTRDNTNKGSILWSEMRRMKKDFNVPIVCGAQVNRNYMNRSEKVPRKTDISDSSAAEKAADALMILHRPYVVDELEAEGDALIQVEKNRSGKEMGSSSRRILLSWDKAHNEYQLREKPGNGDVGHTEGAYVHYSDD